MNRSGRAGTLASNKFFTGTVAHDADDRIIYDSGALIFDSNGSANGGANKFTALDAGLALTNSGLLCGVESEARPVRRNGF